MEDRAAEAVDHVKLKHLRHDPRAALRVRGGEGWETQVTGDPR